MIRYRMHLPARLLVGREVVRTAAREIRRAAGRRVLLIADGELAGAGGSEALVNGFEHEGLSVVTSTEAGATSLTRAAERAAEIGRSGFVEAVVGFGPPNTMGLARLAAALIRPPALRTETEERSGDETLDADEVLDAQQVSAPGVPFVAVPTLPFDPMLCSAACLVTDARNRRTRLISLPTPAEIVLSDDQFLDGCTERQACFSAAGAMLVAIEGMVARRSAPWSTALYGAVLTRTVGLLEAHAEGGEGASGGTLTSDVRDVSLLASLGASQTGLGPGSAACAVIHARTGLGITAAAAAVAGPMMTSIVEHFPDDVLEISRLLGAGGATADILETRIREVLAGVELPLRLRDIGFDERDAAGISDEIEAMGVLESFGGAVGSEAVTEVIDAAG